jgi:hypothetical protein
MNLFGLLLQHALVYLLLVGNIHKQIESESDRVMFHHTESTHA